MPQVYLVGQPILVYYKPPFDKDRISKAMNHDHQRSDMEISYFIEILSSPADIVFDPIVKTGDVLKFAKSLNRRAIGVQPNN